MWCNTAMSLPKRSMALAATVAAGAVLLGSSVNGVADIGKDLDSATQVAPMERKVSRGDHDGVKRECERKRRQREQQEQQAPAAAQF
jgi:hypothetical protein